MKAVIIGNGYSLNDHLDRGDFELLAGSGVDTFGVNEIHRIYHRTEWRPVYCVWVENMDRNGETMFKEHVIPQQEICFIREDFQRQILTDRAIKEKIERMMYGDRLYATENEIDIYHNPSKTLRWINRCTGHNGQDPGDWHLPIFCIYGGVITTALPLAFMIGYDDVAVIGCDLGTVPGVGGDHMDPDYVTASQDYSDQSLDDRLTNVHITAQRIYSQHGRRLVNCGIGGLLEAHPRMDLGEWIND